MFNFFKRKTETIEVNAIQECKLIIKPRKKLTEKEEKEYGEKFEAFFKGEASSMLCDIDFDLMIIKTK
jgi:hypothetical protein